jgi:hypothetical protein
MKIYGAAVPMGQSIAYFEISTPSCTTAYFRTAYAMCSVSRNELLFCQFLQSTFTFAFLIATPFILFQFLFGHTEIYKKRIPTAAIHASLLC